MTERDAKLDARYRELASEEPSAIIDDAIRAAARRAVASRPKSFERRWAAPLSVAAVLVLAVGVTLRMQLEQPGVEVPTVESAAPAAAVADRAPPPVASAPAEAEVDMRAKRAAPAAAQSPAPVVAPKPGTEMQDSRQEKKDPLRRDENFAAQVAPAPAPAKKQEPTPFPASPASAPASTRPATPAPESALSGGAAPAPAMSTPLRKEESVAGVAAPQAAKVVAAQPEAKAKDADAAIATDRLAADKSAANVAAPGRAAFGSKAPPSAMAASGALRELPASGERAADPGKELERIAQLRRDGRNAEADDALVRFKRDFPDYRIPDDVWEKVRPR